MKDFGSMAEDLEFREDFFGKFGTPYMLPEQFSAP